VKYNNFFSSSLKFGILTAPQQSLLSNSSAAHLPPPNQHQSNPSISLNTTPPNAKPTHTNHNHGTHRNHRLPRTHHPHPPLPLARKPTQLLDHHHASHRRLTHRRLCLFHVYPVSHGLRDSMAVSLCSHRGLFDVVLCDFDDCVVGAEEIATCVGVAWELYFDCAVFGWVD
jgi:hypothetical protein